MAKILKPLCSALALHMLNTFSMSGFPMLIPLIVANVRPKTLFVVLLCSLKHPSEFHFTTTKKHLTVASNDTRCYYELFSGEKSKFN